MTGMSGVGTGGEAPTTDKARQRVLVGLSLGVFLASLDQTVVGTSITHIVADLGGLDRIAWLFSTYILTSTVGLPAAGKLSDRLGRRPIFLAGMVFFLAGSVASGLAQTMDQLVILRGLQGIGASMLLPVASATVADLYRPEELAPVLGVLAAVFGVSSILGPLLGGFIVDHASWRWVFFINIPVGAAAIAVTLKVFPRPQRRHLPPMDWLGTALFTACLAALMLAMLWGGDQYAWDSPTILGLVVACIASFAGFILVERRARDPVVPPVLFQERIVPLGGAAMVLLFAALFGTVAFVPLLLQAGLGVTATNSGVLLIPVMLTFTAAAAASGKLFQRTGTKPWMIVGPLLSAVGLALFSGLHPNSEPALATGALLICGLGLGLVGAAYMVAIQASVDRKNLGALSSTITLFRNTGGMAGVALLGALLNQRMTAEAARRLPAEFLQNLPPGLRGAKLGEALLRPDIATLLPAPIVQAIRESLTASMATLFLVAAAACVVAAALPLFFRVPAAASGKTGATAAVLGEFHVPEGDPRRSMEPPSIVTAGLDGNGAAPATASLRVLRGARAPTLAAGMTAGMTARPLPKLLGVLHEPRFPEPGQRVLTRATLAGEGPVVIELRAGDDVVARHESHLATPTGEVRLLWTAPLRALPLITTITRPPP